MNKFKVGDFLRITNLNKVEGSFRKDEVYEVVSIDEEDSTPIVQTPRERIGFFRHELKYLEKVEMTLEEEIKVLRNEIAILKVRVSDLENKQSTQQTEFEFEFEPPTIKTNMGKYSIRQRKEIIEKAKEFINKLILKEKDRVVFKVDKENKTVYAKLMVKTGYCFEEIDVAKAICGREDIYNETLGKAIALGRLYGEDTSEFENAVQPLKYVVGQTVEVENNLGEKHVGEIYKVEHDRIWVNTRFGGSGYVYKNADVIYNNKNYKPVIIDDSNADY